MNKYLNSQKRHHDGVDGPQDALWVVGHLGVIKHLNRMRRQDSLTDGKNTYTQLADEIQISLHPSSQCFGFAAEVHCQLVASTLLWCLTLWKETQTEPRCCAATLSSGGLGDGAGTRAPDTTRPLTASNTMESSTFQVYSLGSSLL